MLRKVPAQVQDTSLHACGLEHMLCIVLQGWDVNRALDIKYRTHDHGHVLQLAELLLVHLAISQTFSINCIWLSFPDPLSAT